MKRSTYKIVLKQTGSLLILLGVVFAICIPVSVIYSEWYSALGFLISALISAGTGYILHKGFFHADEPMYHHALIIAAFSVRLLSEKYPQFSYLTVLLSKKTNISCRKDMKFNLRKENISKPSLKTTLKTVLKITPD